MGIDEFRNHFCPVLMWSCDDVCVQPEACHAATHPPSAWAITAADRRPFRGELELCPRRRCPNGHPYIPPRLRLSPAGLCDPVKVVWNDRQWLHAVRSLRLPVRTALVARSECARLGLRDRSEQ